MGGREGTLSEHDTLMKEITPDKMVNWLMLVKGKTGRNAGMKPVVNTSKPHSRGPKILNIMQKGQLSRLIYA